MSNKLIFIMSDSKSHLRDEVIRKYQDWGFKSGNVRSVETWNPALTRGSISLFGDPVLIHLDLTDKNKLKDFVKLIDDKKQKYFDGQWFGEGMIITSTHARGAKKIENLVTKSDGQVVKKAKPAQMLNSLLSRVDLPRESKDFLKSYAGDDYEILFSVINQIEKLPKEEQKQINVEELIVKLPSTPGSIPPWEFINPMLDGNAAEAIKSYERAVDGSHVLVTMSLARGNLQLLYRIKMLIIAGVWKSDEQAKIVGERNGPKIWNLAKVAKRIDINTAEYLAKLALETEAQLKGYSSADPDVIFKNFIAATCLAINYNKPLPLTLTRRE